MDSGYCCDDIVLAWAIEHSVSLLTQQKALGCPRTIWLAGRPSSHLEVESLVNRQ